jgi:hypothetical protein
MVVAYTVQIGMEFVRDERRQPMVFGDKLEIVKR